MVFKLDLAAAGLKKPVRHSIWSTDGDTATSDIDQATGPVRTGSKTAVLDDPASSKDHVLSANISLLNANNNTRADVPRSSQPGVMGLSPNKSSQPFRRRVVGPKMSEFARTASNLPEAARTAPPSIPRINQHGNTTRNTTGAASRALVLYRGRRRRTELELLKSAWVELPFFRNQKRTPLLMEYGSRIDNNNVRRSRRIAKRLLITSQ